MKYKFKNGGVVKLQNAWTTIPTFEDAFNRAFARKTAIKEAEQKAKEQVESEKPKYTFVNPYDITRGWREATEDAAKQDKYTVQNLGGSEEEAQKAYDNTWKNSRKQLAATTAQGVLMAPMLGEFSTYGLLGGGLRLGTGLVGSKAGEYVFGKGGDWADKKLNTNFLGTTGRIIGGFGGWWGGASATTPLFRNLAGKGITLHMPQETFMNLRNQYFTNAENKALINLNSKSNPILTSTINHLYKEYPELSSIGPKEAYRQYYETIFPASKVQTPYAHGTKSDLSGGLETSVKIPNAAAPETVGRNDFYLNLQPETSLQYADGIGVPKGFTWNKHRFWPLKEILGKPYESDAWMYKPIKLREQVPNRAGQFSRVKNADGTYSGHGKLLEEYKAELGMQDLSNEEFLQRFGVQNEESFNQWVAKNRQMFSDIYNSGDYHGLYHVKIDANKPLTINGGNTYYSERGIWNRMNKGGNDVLLHNNAANEFGSDVAVVRDVTPQKVRILGSKPDQQGFADFMGGKQQFFTEIPTSPQEVATTYQFDGRMGPNFTYSTPTARATVEAIPTPYEIENLGGGYMLKSLMRGNPLEKQISKNGTVNVNNVRALISKGSKVEQAVVDKVLASEEFAGKKSIDYNKFRKAVQDELITYERTPDTRFEDYGYQRIGGEFADPGGLSIAGWKDKLDTYTFSSPRIPNGSNKHYNPNTLGHSRTYTTVDEPDVLHVMESQSDWAQSKPSELLKTHDIKSIADLDKEITFQKANAGEGYKGVNWEGELAKLEAARPYVDPETSYLVDNYTSRQIQENLRYAAEKGQTKMRYPTRETAAKIEGYSKSRSQTLQDNPELQKKYDEMRDALRVEENRIVKKYAPEDYLDESLREADFGDMGLNEEETKQLVDRIRRSEEFERSVNGVKMRKEIIKAREKMDPYKWLIENVEEKYLPQHETILRKYDAFPKQYQKLYKDSDVRIIADSKGNTWYEVDVPKGYLNQEWVYKQGGILKGQSGLEKVPTKNDKPKELIPVKENKSQTPTVLPKESFIDKLRKRWAEMRNETKRPNAFGKFVITREGTKVVDDGGKLA